MTRKVQAVVIGVSAGALEALSEILPVLPVDYPVPVIIVVHLPPHKDSILSELLDSKCNVRVCEAEDKEPLLPGTVYLAPPDYHLLVEKDRSLSLSTEEEILFSRPSIDVLFETAADAYGKNLLGIILTGANEDGSRGLRMIVDCGGQAVVQLPATATAVMMPQSALKACPDALALSLQDIARLLLNVTGTKYQHAI